MPLFENLHPALILLGWCAAVSVVTFFAYGLDKLKAKKGAWRIPEKTLLGLGIIGGAFGAIMGMKAFRHKTKHRYFWVINYAAGFVHILIIGYLAVKQRGLYVFF